MIRLTMFIIALLLAIGTIEPTGPWLVTLAVLAGVELVSFGRFRPWRLRGWVGSRWQEEFDW